MALYRRLLHLRRLSHSHFQFQPALLSSSANLKQQLLLPAVLLTPCRHLSFSSAEEAAAERRRRKRRLRIEPPLHALRRDPSLPSPPRDPNAPRLPDTTSALVGPRLSLHNRVQSLIRSGDLDGASVAARAAVSSRVRPTVFTCNAVAASMVRAGRYDDAASLFDSFFRRSNIVPNVVSYNTLILAHCEAARVDSALAVYRDLLANAPFSPSAVTYRHLTKGLVSASRIHDALDLLREMLSRGLGADSHVYNNLIAGYIHLDRWDKAFELFAEICERCLVYDGVLHTSFMEGYWKKGMDKEAMDSYQSLLDRKFKMTPATCNVLLQTLFKHGKHKEANDLWETMIDNHSPPTFIGINSESYSVMVNQCFKEGRFQEAIEVFHRQPRKNVQMDVACFNNIIGKLCENGMLAEAENLFKEMESKSVLPDVYTYTYLVDSCFKEGRVDDTMQYFYKMADGREHGPKFNIGFFNRMFEGLAEADRIDDALKVYRRMPDKEIKPNTATFEILVKALCKEGDLDSALDLVRDMARGGAVAPPEFLEHVVEIFKNAGRQEEIEKAFEEKPAPLPQPRLEDRPRSSPQGPTGFASNQSTASYVPLQGQPEHGSPQPSHPSIAGSQLLDPDAVSPGPLQPVCTRSQDEKIGLGGTSLQHGHGTPQPPQTGFITMSKQPEVGAADIRQQGPLSQGKKYDMVLPQNQQSDFGVSPPWQHVVGPAQMQQPDFSSAPPAQPGFGSCQHQQSSSTPQTQQTGFGTSHLRQTVSSAPQVEQPRYAAPLHSQPAAGSFPARPQFGALQGTQFGAPQAPQSGGSQTPQFGAPQASQFGAPQVQQPRYDAPLHSQPAASSFQARPQFGAALGTQSVAPQALQSVAPQAPQSGAPQMPQRGAPQASQFGAPQAPRFVAPQPSKSDLGTKSPHGYGHLGNQNGHFGCPKDGQKIVNNQLQQGFGGQSPHSQYRACQDQNYEPRHGQAEFGTQVAPTEYGASRSQPSHGASWSQSGYGSPQGQLGHGSSQMQPHASCFRPYGMGLGVPQDQNNHGFPRVQYGYEAGQGRTDGESRFDGLYGQSGDGNSRGRSGFTTPMSQIQQESSYSYNNVYPLSHGLQGFNASHSKTGSIAPEGQPESIAPEGRQVTF